MWSGPAEVCMRSASISRPWTVRLALWSAHHRWPVFLLWFVATIGIFGASLAGGGIKAQGATGNQGASLTESQRAYAVFNAAGVSDPHETMTIVVTSATLPATAAPYRGTVAAIEARLAAIRATVDGV